MGFELGKKRSYLDLLLSPGPMLTILGLVILLVSVFFFNHASPDDAGIDAVLEAQSHSGTRLKAMLVMEVGTVTSVAGVLFALLAYSRR